MGTRTMDIPRPDWPAALNQLSAAHTGWLVSVEILSAELGAQREVVNLPLIGLTFGPGEGGTIAISAGRPPDELMTHIVRAPQRLWIERTEEGADVALAIDSADGTKTILRFRIAARTETVDGMSPR